MSDPTDSGNCPVPLPPEQGNNQNILRDKIAIIQQSHIFCVIECSCGLQFERKHRKDWRIADDDWRTAVEWQWAQHVADAVIEELGLHRESQFTGDDGSDINVSEWDRERMKTPSAGWRSRYCTRWTVDE